jgi:cyanophycinase
MRQSGVMDGGKGLARAALISIVLLAAWSDPPRAAGKLVIVGGGETLPEIVRRALEAAGGSEARVVVLPQASRSPEAGTASVEMWREAGARHVECIDLADPAASAETVRRANVIWMPGGDQSRLVEALASTPVVEAIRERFPSGAVVGGTSAGAAAMSERMITGRAELDLLLPGTTELVPGLGLWPGVIVDQHFGRRGRFNRLLSAVLDHPDHVGVGIDESTAVIVSGSTFEVAGKGNVMVIDARKARLAAVEAGGRAAATNVSIHVLRAGMRYDLEKGPLD